MFISLEELFGVVGRIASIRKAEPTAAIIESQNRQDERETWRIGL